MTDYPDRSRRDPDIAPSLNIIQAAANLSLIHDLATVTAARDALAAQVDADHATIRLLNERCDEAEATSGARLATLHAQAREIAALRRGLAVLCARLWGRA